MPIVDYPQLFDSVPCCIFVQDRNHRILHTNHKFTERFDCKVGDYCYRSCKQRQQVCPDCPTTQTFHDGQAYQIEETVTDRSGARIPVVMYTSPVRSEDGKIIAVMVVSTDLVEPQHLQRRLAESRERYQDLFDSVPCYISVQDENFRILEANRRFRDEFGDRLGEFCFRVCKGHEEPCGLCPVIQTFEDGEIHTSEEEMQTKSGETRFLVVYTAPILDKQGRVSTVMKMSTDITEVKKLQQHLVLLGEAVATVSHNIKDIVAAMDGGMYLAKSGLERGNEKRMRKGWEIIERNVGRISEEVSDILSYAKERIPRRVIVSPRELIEEVRQLFKEKARSHGITIRRRVRSLPVRFLADPKALHIALVDLVKNAMDACREDQSKPRHHITLTVDTDDSDVILKVSDDGGGIPDSVQPYIFQHFFSTKGAQGAGIGLLVVQKIVEEHGGAVHFRSKTGHGTTFTMRIPSKSPTN